MVIKIYTNLDRFNNQDRTASSINSAKNNRSADLSFKGSPFRMSEAAKKKFYTSKGFQKFAKMTSNPVLLEATVVLGLAAVLRPLTIIKMPGAEKRDKQYASAHSMISGVWGFVTAVALFNPLNRAVENVLEKTRKQPDYLKGTFIKNSKSKQDAFKFIGSYGPKLILQPFVAAVTIALIPAVMHIFFNKDKKQVEKQKNITAQNIKANDNKDSSLKLSDKNSQVQFKGQASQKSKNIITRFYEPIAEKLAQNKYVKRFAEKMSTSDGKSVFMQNILTTAQAFLGTLVYMGSTMKNHKIEEDHKKTLAANQFITWGISAIGTFTISGLIQKKFKTIGANFEKYNVKDVEDKFAKNLITLERKNKSLEKLKSHGQNIAKVAPSMIVFAFIYRYITPVMATPLANLYKKYFLKEDTSKKEKKAV